MGNLSKREINSKGLNEHIGAQIKTQSCKSDINGMICFSFGKFLSNVSEIVLFTR